MAQPGFVDRRTDPDQFERRLAALMAVAAVDAGQDLPSFCADLTARVASVVRAQRVLFSVVVEGSLVVQPRTHGFGPEILSLAVPCVQEGNGLADQVVYHGLVFRGAITDDPAFNPYRDMLVVMQVSNTIAVAVTAGTEQIGLLAAFESERTDGFSDEDIRLLRIGAAAAGLLWRQKRTVDERTRLHEEARSANDAMGLMVNAMVHELRAPLGVVKGYLGMLSEENFGPVSPGMVKPLETIRRKLDEATTLVEDLLLSARLESGAVESHPERIDLGKLATSVAERETDRAQLADGHVAIEKPAGPVLVLADKKHLAMILGNLVRNAIAYSRDAPAVRIEVMAQPEPSIVVSDRGKGISAAAQAHIFERFYRVQDGASPPGTGLGLYISRQLAKQEGGMLMLVWSEEGRGSAFALRFPKTAAA